MAAHKDLVTLKIDHPRFGVLTVGQFYRDRSETRAYKIMKPLITCDDSHCVLFIDNYLSIANVINESIGNVTVFVDWTGY